MTPHPPVTRTERALEVPPEEARVQFGDRFGLAEQYAALLSSTGVDHGLIGPREVPRLWTRHLLNCAVVGELIPHGSRVVDVGSGAGLPGIPLALARPDLTVILVEPLLRRVRWLATAIDELGLSGVTVHRGRAEDLPPSEASEVVTARAVARLARLGAWCAPAVLPGGRLLALKGSTAQTELDEDRAALARVGFDEAAVRTVGHGVVDPPTIVVECRRATSEGRLTGADRASSPKGRTTVGNRGRRRSRSEQGGRRTGRRPAQ